MSDEAFSASDLPDSGLVAELTVKRYAMLGNPSIIPIELQLAKAYLAQRSLLSQKEGEIEGLRERLRVADGKAEVMLAIERACECLPEEHEIHISVENGAASVTLYEPSSPTPELSFDDEETFAGRINAAVDAALTGKGE